MERSDQTAAWRLLQLAAGGVEQELLAQGPPAPPAAAPLSLEPGNATPTHLRGP